MESTTVTDIFSLEPVFLGFDKPTVDPPFGQKHWIEASHSTIELDPFTGHWSAKGLVEVEISGEREGYWSYRDFILHVIPETMLVSTVVVFQRRREPEAGT